LIMGPSGVGKTTLTVRYVLAALERGDKAAFYLFDEGLGTFLARSANLGMDLRPFIANGQLEMRHVDPAELSPGEFAQMVRHAVELTDVKFLAIDSLNAYLQAMPGEKFLLLQMHELLSFLNQKGVTTVLILGEHGLVGTLQRDVDLSYLSDTTVLMRFFESDGELRRAITITKSRASSHAPTIHELLLHSKGIEIGEPLRGFEGVLTGLPTYRGDTRMMVSPDHA
jgi:circadian clock protein KaiC